MEAEAAVSTAVQILGDLLIERVKFLRGVEGQVEWLKDELKRMQGFLQDAAEKQAQEATVRNWISEIKEVAHDAQDAIEMFVLKVESKGLLARFASFPYHLYHLNEAGKEIQCIRARLEAVDKSRERYGIQHLGVSAWRPSENVERRRRLAPWEEEKDWVGKEGDVESLVRDAILGGRRGLSTAAVVGMGGIGKSTLARMVYNHAAVAAGFDCRAWVVVSTEFTPEDVIKQVMLQVSAGDGSNLLDASKKLEEAMNDKLRLREMLQEMLRKQLQGKRYFIVLDDVWEQTHWDSLTRGFPDEQDKSSRLLVTSRNNVFRKCAQYVHEVKLLKPDISWELFVKKAFIDGKCPEELKKIGQKILEKCGGLPLAITVVGGLLAEQTQLSEWEKVLKGINSHLSRGQNSVSAVLELSYQNLSPQLKSCFLCLGFFKEDAAIHAKKLVHIWVAQGLALQDEGKTMEEIAMSYLRELVNRNIVQVRDMTTNDGIKSLQMHDILRELSITKAKEEISFEIQREDGHSQCPRKPYHRAVYCSRRGLIDSTFRNKYLRSLFVHGDIDGASSSYWKSFELLKVLDLEGCFLFRFPDAICVLIGLRYLGLRSTGIRKLPRSLGKLKNLEVLDLRGLNLVTMPNLLWKIYGLRHLYTSGIWCEVPLKISSLKNLQTLSYILLRDSDVEQVTQMTSLCKLGIDMDEISDTSKLFASLAMLENLACLNLRRYISHHMDGLGTLHRITQLKLVASVRLPDASAFPPNLSYLSLVWTSLDEDPMPVLERLPKLLYLKMYRAYYGTKFVVSSDGFLKLKVLSLRSLQYLRSIEVGKGAMPELERLNIHDCPMLEAGNVSGQLRSTIG